MYFELLASTIVINAYGLFSQASQNTIRFVDPFSINDDNDDDSINDGVHKFTF